MRQIAYRAAIREALAEEMARDDTVVLFGEDVEPGGVFNVTPRLVDEFGHSRVFDTPISEMAMIGSAYGAAVCGVRPVVEIMFGDFLGLVIDSLANQASKYWYVSGEQASVPLTIRTAVGGGNRLGPFHSQTPTSWLLGMTGLKLVAPTTPVDAKALTKAAIRDDNPVVVFEHKQLYPIKGEVPDEIEPAIIGQAAVRRPGDDVSIVAAIGAVRQSLAAADLLAEEGIDAEVIDLRTLRPLDEETIVATATRTGRLIVVEDGPPMGGYGAEVIAVACEHVTGLSVRRVAAPDLPIAFSPPLEDALFPKAHGIAAVARALCEAAPVSVR
jgi:acetoin:2,6-dichlorophenolindophenol oxidoreductase subunit beta